MALDIKMPALSPTMEEGTLSKWLIKVGDQVNSGDIMAEIETDKATMEFEAVDEGIVTAILVAEGAEGVRVGTVIAVLAVEGEGAADVAKQPTVSAPPAKAPTAKVPPPAPRQHEKSSESRLRASPLARRLAGLEGIDLATLTGSGPNGRIVKADLAGGGMDAVPPQSPAPKAEPIPAPANAAADSSTPHDVIKLSAMRKVIARRLTESKQQVPHIYLSLDVRLDALLKLRGELNAALAVRGVKLSVNDMLIKALGLALELAPKCNVSFAGDAMLQYSRADVSVAVSVANGLITPIIVDAGGKRLADISAEMAALAERAKAGKLQPQEYQGGTASISNMGMMGIRQFEAVINPPQGMIMAIGAGEARACVIDGTLGIATVMTATGSFDHRAIDGADGAQLMKTFRELIEKPLELLL